MFSASLNERVTESHDTSTNLTIDDVLELRGITERISAFVSRRLRDHLATLAPLLAPGKVFGKHVGARESIARSDEAFAELAENYKQARGNQFELKPELDDEVMTSVGHELQIYPYEYTHEAQGSKGPRKISMTSPARWVVTYGSEYSLSQVLAMPRGSVGRKSHQFRQFVVNALAFQVVLGRNPSVLQMLKDLRWEIGTSNLPGLESLPLLTFGIRLPSFRPADDLLDTAIRLSGVPAFIELIDREAVRRIEDPLMIQIESLFQESESAAG
jgi:hypothetical protein